MKQRKTQQKTKQGKEKQGRIRKLAIMLGLAGLDGTVAVAALAGMFRVENAFSLAVLFMAGPAAILTAALMKGSVRERMFAALLAGIIATLIVILAAGIGPELLGFVSITALKIFGGIAVMMIGLIIMGVKIPERIPTIILLAGFVIGFILQYPA